MFRAAPRLLCRHGLRWQSSLSRNNVRIVEVGPRDGLQNEPSIVSADTKTQLIGRLSDAGLTDVEAGSLVSPKWVPQMADTLDVIRNLRRTSTRYSVLVPNQKGLDTLLATFTNSMNQPPVDEISVFTAATDGFNMANTNSTVADSLVRLAPVVQTALTRGLRVRGYVSVVVACPYTGRVDASKVKEVARELHQMGCYEISLGDTVGMGTPSQITTLVEEVSKQVPITSLAGHFHDTYGMAIANMFAALSCGVRTIDSSVGGLGGCPFSPGATGNVATEDVVYALQGSEYTLRGSGSGFVDLDHLIETGWWISDALKRDNASRVGKASRAGNKRRVMHRN